MNKDEVLNIRKEFFEQILEKLNEEPSKLDEFLNQDFLYFPPINNEVYQNINYGDLVIPVDIEFFNKKYKIYYTVWHVGTKIKIGVVLPHIDLQTAITEDNYGYQELNNIWGKDHIPTTEASHQLYLIDWEFDEPNIFNSYIYREKFILGMKHMSFRICRIIYDKLKKDAIINEME